MGKTDEWIEGWAKDVYPLRLKQGFTIPYAAHVDGEDTFVWILEYDGPEDFDAKNRAYYGSSERKSVHPDPAQLIAKQETRMLTPIVPKGTSARTA